MPAGCLSAEQIKKTASMVSVFANRVSTLVDSLEISPLPALCILLLLKKNNYEFKDGVKHQVAALKKIV